MFAYRTKVQLSKSVDFQDEVYLNNQNEDCEVGCETDQKSPSEEIMYWRKHPNLHGWMEDLYFEKGGKADSFNCVPVELTLEDLTKLEEAILKGSLPHTSGFFFGESGEDVDPKDLEFIKLAKEAIAEGDQVFYDSWW